MNRKRLEKILGMLGSDFEGERANAALLIARMAKEEGVTIVGLMVKVFGTPSWKTVDYDFGVRSSPAQAPQPPPSPRDWTFADSQILMALRRVRNFPLTISERKLVNTIITSKNKDSELTASEKIGAQAIIKRYLKEENLG